MTQHDAYLGPGLIGIPTVGCHDRVRVPDGRNGEVIGFYRDEVEEMLVLFDTGGSQRYLRSDLPRLRATT
jgi:hypothetical protein